jgi:hypothetical protein
MQKMLREVLPALGTPLHAISGFQVVAQTGNSSAGIGLAMP